MWLYYIVGTEQGSRGNKGDFVNVGEKVIEKKW